MPKWEPVLGTEIIALLTDFGLSGPYVAAMKAVIVTICPGVTLIDVTHSVRPQAIEEGAFWLNSIVPYLPEAAVCLAVVDPGVGSERAGIALRTSRGTFVGPDNGLLSAALTDEQRAQAVRAGAFARIGVPDGCEAVSLERARYQRQPVSATFHGRDVFAPAAAHLANGVPLSSLGPPVSTLIVLPPWHARKEKDGSIEGRVVVVDPFGNLITDILGDDVAGRAVCVQIRGREFRGLQRSYQDGPEFPIYIGSSGYLEIARRDGSAADTIGAGPGDQVHVLPEDSDP